MGRPLPSPLASPSGADPPPGISPDRLPPPDAPERWAVLQQIRRQPPQPEPWLVAIEGGRLEPLPDLLAALEGQLDVEAVGRLLRWWLAQPHRDPAFPQRLVRQRHPAIAALLRQALRADPTPELQCALLPLLGHQRQAADGQLLADIALAAHPTPVRRAALEGLTLGLGAWPPQLLRATLVPLIADLDPRLAAAALDALARLPGARPELLRLRERSLEPALLQRLERRLRGRPASPLLLLVHGRSGGAIPAELQTLAAELEHRRGAAVGLRALTAADPGPPPCGERPLLVVPLLLLPGGHVRSDLPALMAALRRSCPVPPRRWPFLGAWPAWQRALAAEAEALAASAAGRRPLLLHHPLEGALAGRYLDLLGRRCGADCRPAPYSSPESEETGLAFDRPVLPLALAANRLTERLAPRLGADAAAPLLQRPALRRLLLATLETLP